MKFRASNFLLLAAMHMCSKMVTGDKLTLQQRLYNIAKYKRSIDLTTGNDAIYARTPTQIGESLYNSLYRQIIHGSKSVDIVILVDGSQYMGLSGFETARKFLARLISIMPAGKFNDGSIKVAMLTYSLSQLMTRQIDFNWNKGIYREMVRRAVKKVRYQGGYENHGTTALCWVEDLFANSSRYNNTNTTKVLLYATNGHITDKDLLRGTTDATYHVAHWLKNRGYKLFTIVPGTSVDRNTISTIASEPNSDYIIPVLNSQAVDAISTRIKDLKRRSHQTGTS